MATDRPESPDSRQSLFTDRAGRGNTPIVPMRAVATTPLHELSEHVTEVTFESVYAELFAFVWRTARRLGVDGSALDDVCQETFVAVHKGLSDFAGRGSVKTWVFGILQNSVRMHHRTMARKSPAVRSRGNVVSAEDVGSADNSPYELVSSVQALRMAHDILQALGDEKRAVFVLVELEQWSVVDAAEALGVNVNTVSARLRAARMEFAAAANRIRIRDNWRTE
jgi:RNA polymerase sigma-70 factor (ECF subfamily)